ncbi:Prp18 domain-containing protein [Lineolata rhizophorae]|uniref:Pre-mRNA-splicing factor 18 n=1 Tax=Lineolata rhizophorae TaxID=578093 RepID=A0A6A6PDY1_9PEZI|nr:Prp18 domain-containing protein [Lineolata rhizophorae]
MDFASLMKSQIAKGKGDNKPKDASNASDSSKPAHKYLKRSEIEAQREAAYRAEQAAAAAEREARLEKKRKLEEEEEEHRREREEKKRRLAEEARKRREKEEVEEERKRRKKLGLPELPPKTGENGRGRSESATPAPGQDIEEGELIAKLREMGEPAKLFGESHKQRLKRYRRVAGLEETAVAKAMSDGPVPTTLELVPEADMKVDKDVPKTSEGRALLYRQLASYFTMLLREWERALAQRDEATRTSFQGKAAYNAMVQARDNMRPLFRKMESDELEKSILEPVVEIVRAAQERRYVDANDAYLRLSIGKAAWPIGVTMVGIHERSAREKLHQSDKGHIMSDENTRKFLQSIKRCLSFAQTRWPPDDIRQLMG